ncbi:MAG TPA: OmpA family protein [Acetobacteraceae bacterium]|jgi:OOP family OmpA-OmpF porin|nr:OmpA family protein [Acetobacteraceae bacterium]
MKFRSLLIGATIISAPGFAIAQPAQPLVGLYIGAGAGVNWLQREHLGSPGGGAAAGNLASRAGGVGVISLGYGLDNGLRFEIEGDFRTNRFTQGRDLGFPAAAGGSERKYGPMFNVIYDFSRLFNAPYFHPYAGVGVGYQWAKLDDFHVYGAGGFPLITSNDTRGALAYQAIVGDAFPISSVPGLALTAEYRFMGVAYRSYNVAVTPAAGAATSFGSMKLGNDFNHAVLIGLRYNFGQAPPPPPPAPIAAPAPAPARSYLVFFDWDKATLNDRARQIIREAADNSAHVQYTRIEVNGYTDTSGTPAYNQGLSMRRAQTVAGELVRDGVPQGSISIQGFGDTHLLVPTGAGVREPQNRRVEIIIR